MAYWPRPTGLGTRGVERIGDIEAYLFPVWAVSAVYFVLHGHILITSIHISLVVVFLVLVLLLVLLLVVLLLSLSYGDVG